MFRISRIFQRQMSFFTILYKPIRSQCKRKDYFSSWCYSVVRKLCKIIPSLEKQCNHSDIVFNLSCVISVLNIKAEFWTLESSVIFEIIEFRESNQFGCCWFTWNLNIQTFILICVILQYSSFYCILCIPGLIIVEIVYH